MQEKLENMYMFLSTSPVGMLNVKVDSIGMLQKTYKNFNWKN